MFDLRNQHKNSRWKAASSATVETVCEKSKQTPLSPQGVKNLKIVAGVALVLFILVFTCLQQSATTARLLAEKDASKQSEEFVYEFKNDKNSTTKLSSFQDRLVATTHNYDSQNLTSTQAMTDGVLELAQDKDQALKLVAFGDRLLQDGKYQMAEPFFRKAMSILGPSLGPNSHEYLDTLQKLAFVCHNLKRYAEEEEINSFIKRINEHPVA